MSILFVAAAGVALAGTITGTVTPPKADSVVYVNASPGDKFRAPAKPFSINQRNLQFSPHVLAVPVGATVEFLNSDPHRHNIFWSDISGNEKLSHNLGTWPQGQTRPFKFTIPGVVPLGCNVHPTMSGFIIVSPTPYFAITDASGNFTITGVPNGTYKVSAWQEGMKIQTKSATVSGAGKVSFTLKQ
jgi:plastocyanin